MSYKKEGESYLAYKQRVIDPKGSSFCGAKWYNATIWLGAGMKSSCHHPPAHRIPLKDILKNYKAIHNTQHSKNTRKQMQEGVRPPECEYCWRIEDMERDAISDRVFKTVIYTDQELMKAQEMPWDQDVNLIALEISFDRTCNFACSYCNASFSTTWAKDIKKEGPYQNLVSDGAKAFQQDGAWAQPYKHDEENPYIEAFWKWWESDLSKGLRELRITGGEPLMSNQVWKLFDYFKDHPSDMLFSINSNMGGKPELIDKLIEKTHNVQNFDLYTSCEATGKQAEYIRDGLHYEYWKDNMRRLITNGNVRSTHVMMTINSLCLFSMTDFVDEMLEMREELGKGQLICSFNLLRFPSFMSPLALPEHLKKDRHDQIKGWLNSKKNHPLLHEMERDGIARLIDYLDIVKTPHRRTSSLDSQQRDFRSFYEQYDRRRGKRFRMTFPQNLVEWYDSIPENKVGVWQGLVEGDSTKGINAELQTDYNPGQDSEGNPT